MTEWFVRPDASHGGANSGASWDNAWQGLGAVVWGASGVGPGDTLLICGTHRLEAAWSVGKHGAVGADQIVTIAGDYAADPGAIVFTSPGFVYQPRSYTLLRGLRINASPSAPCIYQDASTSCWYEGNTLRGGTIGIDVSADVALVDWRVLGNDISGQAMAGVHYLPRRPASVIGPLAINDNRISDIAVGLNTGGWGIRVSTEAAAWDTARLTRAEAHRNIIERTGEHAIWLRSGNPDLVTPLSIYSDSASVCGNIVRNNGRQFGDFGSHGGISVHGFSMVEVLDNVIWDCTVTGGAIQSAKNRYLLATGNDIRRITSGTPTAEFQYGKPIDANGIFFDVFSDGGEARENYIADLPGTGLTNSGTAVAFWNARNCTARSNVARRCYRLATFGHAQDAGNTVEGNVAAQCTARIVNVGTPEVTLDARGNLSVD